MNRYEVVSKSLSLEFVRHGWPQRVEDLRLKPFFNRRFELCVQQRIGNFLLTYRSTKHPTTGRTPASLFLGRELRTRLTLLRPSTGEKVMDSQAKQKAAHDVHIKFREFYPGDRILVKDLRRENTWWPGSVADRNRTW